MMKLNVIFAARSYSDNYAIYQILQYNFRHVTLKKITVVFVIFNYFNFVHIK